MLPDVDVVVKIEAESQRVFNKLHSVVLQLFICYSTT